MQLSKITEHATEPTLEEFGNESGFFSNAKKTILLIDDEPLVTDICEMMIESLGYCVLKTHSGLEGLEVFMANKDKIDLIISDFNMPGMNGQEVVNTLRIMGYPVKVLLSSGGLSAVEAEQVLTNGFSGYLEKPYSMATLSDKISEILL